MQGEIVPVLSMMLWRCILCVTKHHAMKTWGSGGITPHILLTFSRVSQMSPPLFSG